MSDELNSNWKTPVWKVSKSAGQLKRVLRVKEAQAIINNIDVQKQGLFKIMKLSNGDARRWLFALLLSGMRLSELIRLKQNPYDIDGNPLFRSNGSILLPYETFGLKGKQKIVEKERVVILSNIGRKKMAEFLDEKTQMPYFKNGFNSEYVMILFDSILKASAEKIGLPTRTFTRTQKKPVMNDITKQQKIDENGKPIFQKISVTQTTTGVMCRSFRSSWESWLMSSKEKGDDLAMFNILKSIGHSEETARGYYLVSEFDEEDIADMKKVTAGFGTFKKEE